MSEPHAGTIAALSVRSVPGGFIVSWEEGTTKPIYIQQAQLGGDAYQMVTRERVCSGLPALLDLLTKTLRVLP
jgi:hypothetical protein